MKKLLGALSAVAVAAVAQADVVKLFDAVPITFAGTIISPDVQTFSSHGTFASEIGVYVVCPEAGGTATISSNAAGTGVVVVDNFLTLNDAPICTGLVQNGVAMCFTGWNGPAFDWNTLTEETVLAAFPTATFPAPAPYQGVSPLTVALGSGSQLLEFDRWDSGGILSSTELWLSTDCQIPAKVQITHFANGKELCVANPALKAHLEHGDDVNSVVLGCGR